MNFPVWSCNCRPPAEPVTFPLPETETNWMEAFWSSCSRRDSEVFKPLVTVSAITSPEVSTCTVPLPVRTNVLTWTILSLCVLPGVTLPKSTVPPLKSSPSIFWTPEPTVILLPTPTCNLAVNSALVLVPLRSNVASDSARVPVKSVVLLLFWNEKAWLLVLISRIPLPDTTLLRDQSWFEWMLILPSLVIVASPKFCCCRTINWPFFSVINFPVKPALLPVNAVTPFRASITPFPMMSLCRT